MIIQLNQLPTLDFFAIYSKGVLTQVSFMPGELRHVLIQLFRLQSVFFENNLSHSGTHNNLSHSRITICLIPGHIRTFAHNLVSI